MHITYIILGLGLSSFALTMLMLGYGLRVVADHERRLQTQDAAIAKQASSLVELEQRVTRLAEPSKHDREHLARHDVGEAFLWDLVNLREEMDATYKKLDYFTARAEHVAAGGKPDDDPRTWKKVRTNGGKPARKD